MATKNKGSKKQENTVEQASKRLIKSSPAERSYKIVAYVQAALYNARKINNSKQIAALETCMNAVNKKAA